MATKLNKISDKTNLTKQSLNNLISSINNEKELKKIQINLDNQIKLMEHFLRIRRLFRNNSQNIYDRINGYEYDLTINKLPFIDNNQYLNIEVTVAKIPSKFEQFMVNKKNKFSVGDVLTYKFNANFFANTECLLIYKDNTIIHKIWYKNT